MTLIEQVLNQTDVFLSKKSKHERKAIGQFFTDGNIALFMASLFRISSKKSVIKVLDPGAGTGILSAAFIEEAINKGITQIDLTLVENNSDVLEILRENAKLFKDNGRIVINVKIIEDNYLTMQALEFSMGSSNVSFDYIIGNPPYLKIPRNASETFGLEKVISGTPNLYFLFLAMSIFNLKDGGELVYIIPRSWTSGAYFRKFREYLLKEGYLEQIHLFASRTDTFKKENILQETIILKFVKKTINPKYIVISSSEDSSFEKVYKNKIEYTNIVRGAQKYIFLPTTRKQIDVLRQLDRLPFTLPEIGLKLKTGLTVDFRNRESLKKESNSQTIPLVYASNISKGRIEFPSLKEKYQYLIPKQKGMVQDNKDYVLLKRFSSKEEHRRLQPAIYLKENINSDKISTDNKLNFIERLDKKELPREQIFGLFAIFNSSLYDEYYRILNGSTQVNATEINDIPVPSLNTIADIGKRIMVGNDLSTQKSDEALSYVLGVKN